MLGALLALLLLLPTPAGAQKRVLRCQQVSDGRWLQRVDSGDKSEAKFQTECAAQFGRLETEVRVVITTMTETERQRAVEELAAGTHEGQAVIAAPAPTAEQPEALRVGLGGIFAGTPAQKRARMLDVVEKYPALGTALNLLRGTLTPDAKAFIAETATRLKAKIGTGAGEVLTQTEYDTLKALATQQGLGGLIP